MQTQHNVFIRKFGNLAVIITITDWEDFKELEEHSNLKNPDFLLAGVTTRNIYTNMNPSILLGTKGEVKDITKHTKGMGLEAIITGDILDGPVWAYRKIDGLSAVDETIKPNTKDLK